MTIQTIIIIEILTKIDVFYKKIHKKFVRLKFFLYFCTVNRR